MEENALRDYNEEIIFKLKELNKILERIMQEVKDGKERTPPRSLRY